MQTNTVSHTRRIIANAGVGVLVACTSLAVAVPAVEASQPVPSHSGLVPDAPRTDTPRVENGEIADIEVVGDRVYLSGSFTSIRNSNGTPVAQPYLAAYDINTGQLDMGFRPVINGSVAAVEASPNGSALYIAGNFSSVNGSTKRKLARINPTSGATVTTFTAHLDARGTSLAVSDNWVYVGGFFAKVNSSSRGRLAAVNPNTGAVDNGFNIPVTEGIGSGGTLKVLQLQLTTDDATLLVVHSGRKVAAQQRVGIAMVTTASKALSPWNTQLYADYLPLVGGVIRLTSGDISPDNSYFVVVSGGGGDKPPVNDTAVAFPMDAGSDPGNVQALWVSRHFDSLYSVAVTETAVYMGGHFRYQESATSTQPWPGGDTQNYGWGESLGAGVLGDEVVRRDMLGALDPATGTALEWNPGAEALLGHGHLEAIPRGLLVGIDGTVIAGQSIGRHAFFDFNNIPPPSAAETWIDYPFEGGTVAGGSAFTFEGRASAVSTVSRVQLEIQKRTNNEYLQDDGVTWSATWNAIDALLGESGSAETPWSFTSAAFPAGSFRIYARTFAQDGSRDNTKASKKFEAVVQDNAAPDTQIILPLAGMINTNTFVVTGKSYDDTAVTSVSIDVRDTNSNRYLQDDGSFSLQFNTFQADATNLGTQVVDWEFEMTVPDGEFRLSATARDETGQSEHKGVTRRWTVSATSIAPSIILDTPIKNTIVTPGTPLLIQGTAADDTSVRRVDVSLRNNNTGEGVQLDGTWGPVPTYYQITPVNTDAQTLPFSYTTPPLPIGSYTLRVRATDNMESRTPTTAVPPSTVAQPNVKFSVGFVGDVLPDTLLTFAATTQEFDDFTLPITGTATDALGVGAVKLVIYNSTTLRYLTDASGATSFIYSLINVPVDSPGATSTAFSFTATLPGPGNYTVTAMAVDSMGQYDGTTTGATATYLIFPGDTDPTLVADLQTPVVGSTFTNFIPVGGRALDDLGIARVTVTVRNTLTGLYLRADGTMGASSTSAPSSNLPAYLTNPGGPGSNFNYSTVTLAPGTYEVSVQPVDNVGQVLLVPYLATVTVIAG